MQTIREEERSDICSDLTRVGSFSDLNGAEILDGYFQYGLSDTDSFGGGPALEPGASRRKFYRC